MGTTRTRSATQGLILDAGALIALDRGDRRMIALLEQALAKHLDLRVPAGVVGQAWTDGARQAMLARFLRAREVRIEALDDGLARACGELCAATATSDVIDASVVILARQHGDIVLTSDPEDLRTLDAAIAVQRI